MDSSLSLVHIVCLTGYRSLLWRRPAFGGATISSSNITPSWKTNELFMHRFYTAISYVKVFIKLICLVIKNITSYKKKFTLMLFFKTISCCKVYNLKFMTIGPFFYLPILHLWLYMHAVVWNEYKLLRKKEYVKKWQIALRYDKYFISRLYAYKIRINLWTITLIPNHVAYLK